MQIEQPNIIFIGGTKRGLAVLKKIIAGKEKILFAYILQEDEHEPFKVSGEIKSLCESSGIPTKMCKKLNNDDEKFALSLKPDVIFVCGWRTILSAVLYKNVPLGCLAAHDSLLPKYRGFAPTAWAIINGESETGVSLFKIDDKGVDAGDVVAQKMVSIHNEAMATEVYEDIICATVDVYTQFLDNLKKGTLVYQKQDSHLATFAKKRTPADGEICWNQPSKHVFNFIRALMPPYPYSWTRLDQKIIFIKKVSLFSESKKEGFFGEVLSAESTGAYVQCAEGVIQIITAATEEGNQVIFNKGMKVG